jgi:hypothetical protein
MFKAKRFTKLLVFFLFVLSALAIAELTTDVSTRYDLDERITFSGTCDSSSVAFQLKFSGETVWYDQTLTSQDSFSTFYNTKYQGDHTLHVSCGQETQEINFCVGTEEQCEDNNNNQNTNTQNTGGGGSCRAEWVCESWSLCNSSLQQERDCYDQRNCKPNKVETQPCDQCQESWICSLWGGCSDGVQKRDCVDQHYCETTFVKPLEQKNCGATVGGNQPMFTTNDIPPPAVTATSGTFFGTTWEKYSTYILVAGIVLILIILSVILIAHYAKPQKLAYNHDELVGWITRERGMGTSDTEIRQILTHKTGWNEEEINEAFEELQQPQQRPYYSNGDVATS